MIKGIAAGLAAAACSTTREDAPDASSGSVDAAPAPIDPEPIPASPHFPLGVAAGDLAGDRGVLWAQYAGTSPLVAYAWRITSGASPEQLGPFAVTPADGGYLHLALHGLAAGARYRYAFFELADGTLVARSPIGTFRAPIADTASEVLTFGAIACTQTDHSPGPLARAAARTDLDAFIYLGDNAYCDGAVEVAEYRALYREHFARPEYIALRGRTGTYITWDDHEIKNDTNPESMSAAQLAAAFQAFFEHAPIAKLPGAERRIWRSARWGRTAEIFVLDCRSERRPSTIPTSAQQYLSPAQLAWLKAGLLASPARFKLIVNSVPITNMPSLWDAYPTDRWEAYGQQRTDILSFIDQHQIPGIVWLGGDFHLAFISYVSTSGAGSTQREVLCGPGGANSNNLLFTLDPPQFSYATGTNNYTTLRLDPAAGSITVQYHDGDGTMFHSESFIP